MPTKITFRTRWKVEEELDLLSMRLNGMAYEAIAYTLGRSTSAVNHKWLALQKAMNPKSRKPLSLLVKLVGFVILAAGFLYLAATTPTA